MSVSVLFSPSIGYKVQSCQICRVLYSRQREEKKEKKNPKHQLLKINDFAFCNDLLLLSAMCGRCNFNLARRRLCNVPAGLRPVYLNVYNNLICYNTFKTIQKHVSGFIRAITAHPNCYFNYCYVLLVPES